MSVKELNDDIVELLQRGCLRSCTISRICQAFKHVVYYTKKSVARQAEIGLGGNQDTIERSSNNSVEVEISSTALPDLADEMCLSPDGIFLIYNRALLLSPHENDNQELEDLPLNIVVVLYNLGLAFHREGLLRGRSDLLRKAHSIYLLALENISHETCNKYYDSILSLAIANNIGHVSSHLFDFIDSGRIQDILAEMLIACTEGNGLDSVDVTENRSAISDADYEAFGFVVVASHSIGRHPMFAAPAA